MTAGIYKNLVTLIFIAVIACSTYAQKIQIQTIDVAPFGYINHHHQPTGMMYEISNLIAEKAGLSYSNKIVPYARTVMELQEGHADFVLRYSNDQLPIVAIPVASIISMQTIVLSKRNMNFNSVASLHNKRIGVVRGGKFDKEFDSDNKIHKIAVSDYAQMLKMLMSDRLDGVIGSNVGLYYNAKILGIEPKELNKPLTLHHNNFILHYSKKTANKQTTKRIVDAVNQLKNDQVFKKIVDKYMGDFDWDSPLQSH